MQSQQFEGFAPATRRRALALIVSCLALAATACVGDSDVELCEGDDPLPECSENGLGNTLGSTSSTPNGDTTTNTDTNPTTTDQDPACNPNGEPTWTSPVGGIIRTRCARCHSRECASYDAIGGWIDDGSLRTYVNRKHFISGTDKTTVTRWLDLGAPETDCDVP